MVKKFIERPILATVFSLILVLLGLVGLIRLPITRFPVIAPPSVSVSASYSGADAETVAQNVLLPLEESINGVKDMTYMESQASTGSGVINIYFKQGTDPEQAAVNVDNRTSKALKIGRASCRERVNISDLHRDLEEKTVVQRLETHRR